MSSPLAKVQHGQLSMPIEVGSPEWFTWLEHTDAFTVEEQGISFTVHRVYHGESALWLAFCDIDHEVRWAVLGSASELVWERLQATAHQLMNWVGVTPEFLLGLDREGGALPHLPVANPDLPATKLEMPILDTAKLVRTRGVDRLAHALEYPITVVSAPSGYGKTTLLAEWASETPARVAWLALDENDNDPVRFCIHLLAALDRVVPGALAAGLPYGQNAQVQLSDVSLRTRLINSLAAAEGPIALVLDDYHTISQETRRFMTRCLHRPISLFRRMSFSQGALLCRSASRNSVFDGGRSNCASVTYASPRKKRARSWSEAPARKFSQTPAPAFMRAPKGGSLACSSPPLRSTRISRLPTVW